MRAWLAAAVLLFPALARAGVVQLPARAMPVKGGQGVNPVRMGGMRLNPDLKLTQGVFGLPGNSSLSPDQVRSPIVNFAPQLDVPALPYSAVGQTEAGQYLETAAFETYTEPMKLQRMVPPGGLDAAGGVYAPMREQSQALSSKQAVISEEIEAAVNDSGSGAEGALAFGDRVWDALLGGAHKGRTGSDRRPSANGFTGLAAKSVPGSTLRHSPRAKRGTASDGDSPAEGATLTRPSEGSGAVETVSALPSFMLLPMSAVLDPSAFAVRGAVTKTVRVLPIPRIMLTVYNGAMGLAYNTVPGHSFSTRVSYTAAAGLAQTRAARTASIQAPVFASPALTSVPSFTGMTFTQASEAMPGAEAERFAYLQTAGQSFPSLSYSMGVASPFQGPKEASSSPLPGLPLWAFPVSAVLPLLALGLLVRQD